MKSKNKQDRKVGVFVPPPLKNGETASIHNPGIGRITSEMHNRLWQLLNESPLDFQVIPDLSFRDAVINNGQVIFPGHDIGIMDGYFWYSEIDRKPNSFNLSVLKEMAARIPVVRDPFIYERALDKHTAFSLLRTKGVPVPDSVLVDAKNIHQIKSIVGKWGMAVMKPRRGGFGKGVTLLDSFEVARDTAEYIQAVSPHFLEGGFHLERFYENDISRWTSVTIVDGKIWYGYRKNSERLVSLGNGKVKVYDSDEVGGSVHLCEVSELHKQIALKAYHALGIEIVGFDLIWHDGRPIIVDINTFPGMYQSLLDEKKIDGGECFFNLLVDKFN